MFSALGHQFAAHFGGTGKTQLANNGGVGQGGGNCPGTTGNDAENAGRNAGPLGQLCQCQCRIGGGAGRFDDHGTAGCQSRPRLAGNHGRGEIPGGDRGGDTDGLFDHHDTLAGFWCRDGVAVGATGFFSKPFQKRGGVGNFAFGFGQGFALLQCHQQTEVVLMFHHQVMPGFQQAGPFCGSFVSPRREGGMGGINGAAGFGLAHAWRSTQRLFGGRVVHRESATVVRITPLTVDVALLTEK